MIKEKKPLTMYEALEVTKGLKETDKIKALEIFIKEFANSDAKTAAKIKEAVQTLNLIKLKETDIIKIVELMPENATELNKIVSETSLDADETSKVLDAVKSGK